MSDLPTMDDVMLCVAAMRDRVECGHTHPDEPMARLSLAMTEVLLGRVAELERDIARLGGPDPDACLWIELSRLAGIEGTPCPTCNGQGGWQEWTGHAWGDGGEDFRVVGCPQCDEHGRVLPDMPRALVVGLIRRSLDQARASAWRLKEAVERFLAFDSEAVHETGASLAWPTMCPPSPELVDLCLAADDVPADWMPSDDG